MIDNMYAVMRRINDIRQRFGLKARPQEQPAQASDYRRVHDTAMADAAASKKPVSVDEINRMAERYGRQYHVPPSLVKAVIRAESDYNPAAVSPKGAMGLMQLMPSVAKSYGLSDPFSPEDNVRAGTALLGELLNEYDGDYKLALSAYNAGPAAVKSHDGVPDYPETKDYIKKVIDSYLKNR